MCSNLLVEAGQDAYFGPMLKCVDPQLPQVFLDFDKRSWQLLFGLPYFLSMRMHKSKDMIISALTTYFRLPSEQKEASVWSVDVLETEMRHLGLKDKDIATMMMILYWG